MINSVTALSKLLGAKKYHYDLVLMFSILRIKTSSLIQ